MRFKLLTQATQVAAIVAGVLGAGAFAISPAVAQGYSNPENPTNSNQAPTGVQQSPSGQMPLQAPMNETPTNQTTPNQAPTNQAESASGNIVEVASGSGSFNTLTQAIEAAGLTDTLSQGSYTVFAPTDEAFAELPEGALEFLLQPENRDLLQQVLTYHVVPSEVTSSEIATGPVEAIGGGLAVRVTDSGRVIVNNASVVQPNIEASNGVIHAVNRVLLPTTLQDTLASELGVTEIYQ